MFKITTQYGDSIEVETEHELAVAIDAIRALKQRVASMPIESKPLEQIDSAATLQLVFGKISPKTKTLRALFVLRDHPEGLAAEKLIQDLNLEKGNGQALGGIFGGISRFLRRSGLSPENVYSHETKDNTEIYRLSPIALEALEAMKQGESN
ncbi:MAG: hypothetical protein WAU62_03705 [Dehalococcoidales bacterium]